MNTIVAMLVEIGITLLACLLIVSYLRPYLKRVLVDLCGAEERAQFWVAFSNILLIGLPLIIALGFRPHARTVDSLFFAIMGRLSGSLAGLLAALAGLGIIVSFFALVAPRPPKAEPK